MVVVVEPYQVLSATRRCAQAFFDESKIEGELNLDHFAKTWENFLQLDIGRLLVYRRTIESESLGLIGGIVSPCPMTGDIIGTELFWWVDPILRGKSPAAFHLLQAWMSWCKDKGAKRIYVGNLVELNDEKMQSIYQRLGFRPLEVHYVKTV